MSRRRKHWSDTTSGDQDRMEAARLRARRDKARWERDRKALLAILHGEVRHVEKLSPQVRRLIDRGAVAAAHEFFPREGIDRWRLTVTGSRPWPGPERPPRKIDIDPPKDVDEGSGAS